MMMASSRSPEKGQHVSFICNESYDCHGESKQKRKGKDLFLGCFHDQVGGPSEFSLD